MFKSKTFLPHCKILAFAESQIQLIPSHLILFSSESIQFGLQNTINFYISSHSLAAYFIQLCTLQNKTPKTKQNSSWIQSGFNFVDSISHKIVHLSNSFLYFIAFCLEYTMSHPTSWSHSTCFSLPFSVLEGREPKLEAILEIKLPR